MTKIDPYSLATVPVRQCYSATTLGEATAFVWERRDTLYLITNWHVVTCRNYTTGRHLANHAGEPNKLIALFNPKERTLDKLTRDVSLRDANEKPKWLVHPPHRHKVDVVAIPLSRSDGEVRFEPINKLDRDPLRVEIGMDVYVLGYPFGAPPPSLPVWKRGSIASEPQLARLTQNYFLVDTASRPGMSGAPVIRRSWGSHLTESGTSLQSRGATKFVGIYSGRLATNDPLDAQLGIVWPESLITEIIDAPTLDDAAAWSTVD